jgi:hypothetical protein
MVRLARATWILSMLLLVSSAVLFFLSRLSPLNTVSNLILLVAFASFGIVGMLITVQRPQNTVGWILCAMGVTTGTTAFSAAYTQYNASLPGAGALTVLGNVVWPINLLLPLIFLPLLFPNGCLLTRRWRVVVWLALVVLLLDELTSIMLGPPYLKLTIFGTVLTTDFWNTLSQDIELLLFPLVLSALISVIIRFVKSRGNERQQMKWLTYGTAVAIVLVVVGVIVNDATNFLFATAFMCIPLSIGISILRYRLYDIDRLISRTLIYLLLSALLALTYLALIFGLQFVLQGITQNSPIPIVVSTLAIAALFQPLRRIAQNVIDRSFYRRRYDAEKVLAGFGTTLRNELDLEQLRDHLTQVVRETVQPEHISLWLYLPGQRDNRKA